MEFLRGFFVFAAVIAFFLSIAGLVKPKLLKSEGRLQAFGKGLAACFVLLVIGGSLVGPGENEEVSPASDNIKTTKEETKQAEIEKPTHIYADSSAIAKVRASQKERIMVPGKTAELRGGVVVYYEGPVYWVQGEKVFAVNGIAKGWSPDIDYSPEGVDYSSAKKAIEERYSIVITP